MKKVLLLAAAALMVTSANAQLTKSEAHKVPARPQTQLFKPQPLLKEAQMRTPGTPVVKVPRRLVPLTFGIVVLLVLTPQVL